MEPVKEHRFVVVPRGDGLGGNVLDTDPGLGVPLDPVATILKVRRRRKLPKNLQAREILKDQPQANYTMRGFAAKPTYQHEDVYGLKAAAVAVYPIYKGLARLVGMDIIGNASNLDEQAAIVKENWENYDFFFVHFKYTDSTGEDGNLEEKKARTEDFDAFVPKILELDPSVVIVTGDHNAKLSRQSQLASCAYAS